jgi:hypothetical protein
MVQPFRRMFYCTARLFANCDKLENFGISWVLLGSIIGKLLNKEGAYDEGWMVMDIGAGSGK